MTGRLAVDRDAIADFCRKHGIRRLAFFDSVLRDDFSPESDVDVLVEFEPGHRIGLLGMAALELELSAFLQRKVDLRTPGDLSRHFRDEVLAEAEEQYGLTRSASATRSTRPQRRCPSRRASTGPLLIPTGGPCSPS